MGRYVKDREFIYGTEQMIREVITEYDINIREFEQKNNKRAGVRARANLLELGFLCKKRRREILERRKELGKWEVHPSWEGVDENEQ